MVWFWQFIFCLYLSYKKNNIFFSRFSFLVLVSCLLHSLTESETSYTWRLDLAGGKGEAKIVADMGIPPRPGDETQV